MIVTRIVAIVLALFCLQANAQTVTGAWYGRADVVMPGANSNYLTELIIRQKGSDIEGVFGYYFKDAYQSFFVRGTYDARTRQLNIRNLPIILYASSARTGIECPMHFLGTLLVSRVKSTLRGTFYSDKQYRYTCPDLSVNMTLDASEKNLDISPDNTVAGQRFWKPDSADVVVNANTTAASDTNVRPAAASETSIVIANQSPDADAKLIEEFGKRNNIYQKDIVVYDDSILVSFYDNGDIDDDTISVFLNKKPILVKRGLTARALNIYIGLDSTKDVNELSMFAENLGEFPPNTALMVISDRQIRYELYLSASLKQNSSVRLRRPDRQ